MNIKQFSCLGRLAESLGISVSQLKAMCSDIAGYQVAAVTDLSLEQADKLIDRLAAVDLLRKRPQAELPQAKKESA